MGKLKTIILILLIGIVGVAFVTMPNSDKSLKRKNTALKNQIEEVVNYNNALREQNKVYESSIRDLTLENQAKDSTISELQSQNQEKDTTISDLQSQIEELEEQLSQAGTGGENEEFTLTGTTWKFNDTVFLEEGNPPTSQIDFTVSGLDYNFKYIGIYKFTGPDNETVCELHYAEDTSIPSGLMVCFQTNFEFGSWQNESYRIITITGGTDATKAELIAWLETNATQVISFTIKGTTYYAEPGMTWNEWVETSYNTGDFSYGGSDTICHAETMHQIDDIKSYEEISANGVYTMSFIEL